MMKRLELGSYALSLHDALPISLVAGDADQLVALERDEGHPVTVVDDGEVLDVPVTEARAGREVPEVDRLGRLPLVESDQPVGVRSEEHTSELQSRENVVCRLLL